MIQCSIKELDPNLEEGFYWGLQEPIDYQVGSNPVNYIFKGKNLIWSRHDLSNYVDFGLPSGTLWSKCNIGATKETDFGLFFQFGSLSGEDSEYIKKESWETCPGNGGNSTASESSLAAWDAINLTNNELNKNVDAAYKYSGGVARIPSEEQFQELIDHTQQEYVKINATKGIKFSGKKDSSKYIFIPLLGNDVTLYGGHSGYIGEYYTRTGYANIHSNAYVFRMTSEGYSTSVSTSCMYRCYFLGIRGVVQF